MLLETIRRATAPSSIGESVEKEVEAAAVALLELWADLVVHQPSLMDVFLKDATAGQLHARSTCSTVRFIPTKTVTPSIR